MNYTIFIGCIIIYVLVYCTDRYPTTSGPSISSWAPINQPQILGEATILLGEINIFPMIFLWFSRDFPMIFPVKSPFSLWFPRAPTASNSQALRGVGGIILNAEGKRFCNELGRRWAKLQQLHGGWNMASHGEDDDLAMVIYVYYIYYIIQLGYPYHWYSREVPTPPTSNLISL